MHSRKRREVDVRMTISDRVELIPWLLMAADLKQDYYFILHTNIHHLVALLP